MGSQVRILSSRPLEDCGIQTKKNTLLVCGCSLMVKPQPRAWPLPNNLRVAPKHPSSLNMLEDTGA
ncbi:hypothetical protein D8M06_00175 [Oceanobacillus halophilus]|uniref:Uncharacterized protein n=1 Tax=Oceanobacillus halophilus TaxID=930130 RepID=A0A495AC98_9BACI|nr:hypothetical protein D8M06_00175 [Oceanobacillus halophilus]